MVKSLPDIPLLEDIIHRTRLPWYVATTVIAVVLLLLLILVAYAESDFTNQIDWGLWRLGLQPAIIIYILVMYPVMKNLWSHVVKSCLLLVLEEDEVNITPKITSYNRRREWIALLVGAVFVVVYAAAGVAVGLDRALRDRRGVGHHRAALSGHADQAGAAGRHAGAIHVAGLFVAPVIGFERGRYRSRCGDLFFLGLPCARFEWGTSLGEGNGNETLAKE